MLMGEFNHTLDTKGRLIIPQKIREDLGESFVISKSLDHCLAIYPMEEWQVFTGKLAAMPQLSNPNARKLNHFFIGGAAVCEVDKQGRILIPANLRNFAGLTKDVVLVGQTNKVEVWDKAAWEAYNDYDDVEALAGSLAEFGI